MWQTSHRETLSLSVDCLNNSFDKLKYEILAFGTQFIHFQMKDQLFYETHINDTLNQYNNKESK